MLRQTILKNISSQVAARGVGLVVAICITPFLIRELGQATYGLWMLVASFVGFFGLTDLGLRSAVGRFIALHKTKGEHEKVNSVVVTALGLLSASALLVIMVTVISSYFFSRAFNIEPEQLATAQKLVLIIGFSLALGLPLDVFDGILIGHARYSWINGLDIIATLTRAVLAIALLTTGYGVLALALSNLGVQLTSGIAKLCMSIRVCPKLKLAPSSWNASLAKELYAFSIWAFIMFLWTQFIFTTGNLIAGWVLNTSAVAVYAIASRLTHISWQGSTTLSYVLMPHAAEFHARGELQRQQWLVTAATKASLFYGCFVAAVFLVFGPILIRLWVGPAFHESAKLLLVLTVPLLGLISQNSVFQVLFAMARHKWLALICIADALAGCALALLFVRQWGVTGIALGIAFPTTITTFLVIPAYACFQLEIPVLEYFRRAYSPVLISTVLLVGGLLVIRWLWTPLHLVSLATLLAGVTIGYFGAVYYFHFAQAKQAATV